LNIGILPIVKSRVRELQRGKRAPISLSLSPPLSLSLLERSAFPAFSRLMNFRFCVRLCDFCSWKGVSASYL